MTVKELIEFLQQQPMEAKVLVRSLEDPLVWKEITEKSSFCLYPDDFEDLDSPLVKLASCP